ncbi:MAG: SIS domain-containing protein [Lachnospiraceae bacterium]|nr:SIS domain-containing protein [Lachnospiraceae bacterium]
MGNGGSAAIAGHMSADFLKNGGLSVVSMYSIPTITCLGNDFCYDDIFSKQLEMNADKGELLVSISSSGDSESIYRAVTAAKEKGMNVITLTGFRPDNRTRDLGDVSVYVPSNKYGIVESVHNLILQQVVDEIAARK